MSPSDISEQSTAVQRKEPLHDVLIVEDDVAVAEALQRVLNKGGYSTAVAHTLEEADTALKAACNIVLLDLTLPDGDGISAVNRIKASGVKEIIVVSGTDDAERTRQCLHAGVFDFVLKPVTAQEVLRAVRRADAYHHRSQTSEKEYPARLTLGFGGLEGCSVSSVELTKTVNETANRKPVRALITGQPGVLKADVAARIHQATACKGDALIINAANETVENAPYRFFSTIDENNTRLDAEEASSYLDKAAAGTLVIDDLSVLPLVLQRRLACLLDGEIAKPDPDAVKLLDVGIIGILREPVKVALDSGRLHRPLYYALANHEIRVPPLVERKEDIPLLAQKAVEQLNQIFGCEKSLSPEILEAFDRHFWPGNLVELRNSLLTAYRVTEDGEDIRPDSVMSSAAINDLDDDIKTLVGKSFQEVERMLINATLKAMDNSKTATAETLGISVKTLYNRLKKYA